MRCQFCDGTGKLSGLINNRRSFYPQVPCGHCGGTGHLHCCEGLREQPETEKDCEDEHR